MVKMVVVAMVVAIYGGAGRMVGTCGNGTCILRRGLKEEVMMEGITVIVVVW